MKRYNITVNGTAYDVTVEEADMGAAPVAAAAPKAAPKAAAPKAAAPAGAQGGVKIEAPMPGTVVEVKLKVGDKVTKGQEIAEMGTSTSEKADGCHLHFEVLVNGNPADPNDYLSSKK